MGRPKSAAVVRELLEKPPAKRKRTKKRSEQKDDALERVLSRVSAEPTAAHEHSPRRDTPKAPVVPGMRTARVITAAGRAAEIQFRGERRPVTAAVAPEVEAEVLARAAREQESVLVEVTPDSPPLVVGVIQTRMPRSISLKGTTVEIEAEREILLKTGRGALRIREDGDVEIVGSRIVAMSRGLFRLVGKMLRLN